MCCRALDTAGSMMEPAVSDSLPPSPSLLASPSLPPSPLHSTPLFKTHYHVLLQGGRGQHTNFHAKCLITNKPFYDFRCSFQPWATNLGCSLLLKGGTPQWLWSFPVLQPWWSCGHGPTAGGMNGALDRTGCLPSLKTLNPHLEPLPVAPWKKGQLIWIEAKCVLQCS